MIVYVCFLYWNSNARCKTEKQHAHQRLEDAQAVTHHEAGIEMSAATTTATTVDAGKIGSHSDEVTIAIADSDEDSDDDEPASPPPIESDEPTV